MVLLLVLGTMWLVNRLYNDDWAPTDPRGSEGKSWMARSAAGDGRAASEPQPTPPPPFSDFKRPESR